MNQCNPEIEKILKSYEVYYDVNNIDVEEPFIAEAVFHSHDEQYFLTKRATIAEMESNEYVYFATTELLDLKKVEELANIAWERGLAQIKPSSNHRNSDIVLIILAQSVTEDAIKYIKKANFTKSYKFSFHGWSNFELVVKDKNTGKLFFNRFARNHKELFNKIL